MRAAIIFVSVSMLILAGLALRPILIPNDISDCQLVKGVVVEIYEGGVKDIVFKLDGEERIFYINRGLELGLVIDDLKTDLLNEEVTIYYPEHWTILDLSSYSNHLSVLYHDGQLVFSEIASS